MKNSEKYFHGVAGFIEDMAEINAAYDKEIRYLEPYRGSEGFTQGVQKAQAVRDADVQRMRETYLKQFRETVQQMREAINHRPLVPPTPEQTSLLSVLSMRESLTQDELTRAAEQMAGCQAALAVLDDLAAKHKVRGWFNREASAESLRKKVDTLERAALSLIQEGAGAASKTVPKDVTSCLNRYGCFNPVPRKGLPAYANVTSADLVPDVETIKEFCRSVDGGRKG